MVTECAVQEVLRKSKLGSSHPLVPLPSAQNPWCHDVAPGSLPVGHQLVHIGSVGSKTRVWAPVAHGRLPGVGGRGLVDALSSRLGSNCAPSLGQVLSSLSLFSSSVTGTPLGEAGAEHLAGPVSSHTALQESTKLLTI